MIFTVTPTRRLFLTATPFPFLKLNSADCTNSSVLSFTHKFPTRSDSVHIGTHLLVLTRLTRSSSVPFDDHSIFEISILLAFSLVLLFLRLFSNVFLPDFPARWRWLVAFSEEAEARTSSYPAHLRQAIVAYEDKRFYSHLGIDPIAIARAFLSFSELGGGSTITQQLVKNIFLKNERTLLRKSVEIVLALALERTVSKESILSCYMSKIYWGHGIYGIESASVYYFRKHPSHLSLGESAMLAGLIPAPELRSPFRDPTRGRTFQARVLKRMIEVGVIDTNTALLVVNESLDMHAVEAESSDGLLHQMDFSRARKLEGSNQLCQEFRHTHFKGVWNWEKESKIWEVREDMETWARTKTST